MKKKWKNKNKKKRKKRKSKNENKRKKKKENADLEYYTTYPKTPEKRAGNPNFWLCLCAPKGTPFGVT